MSELVNGVVNILIYFIVCASSAALLRVTVKVPDELFRKLLHCILLGSLMIWTFCFETWWISALVSIGFAAIVYPILALAERIKGYSELLTERNGGELKHSLLLVFGMFAVVIAVCWGWLGDKMLVLASVYAWGFGDAAAALIGKRFGRHGIEGKHIEGRKSVEGCFAMFCVSFVSVVTILMLRGEMGTFLCVVIAVVTAAVATMVELFSLKGNDTVTCPLAAMAVLILLLYLANGIMV